MQLAYPKICALRKRDLQGPHWVKIKETVGIDLEINPDQLTLQYLIDVGAREHRKEFAAISDEASSEAVLNEVLNGVVEKWNKQELHTKHLHGDAYLLVDIDDLMRDLDDATVQLATIRVSQQMDNVREKVETWYTKQRTFANTLDVRLLLEQKWLSLEVVFQGDELLKEYSKKFRECYKFWHDLMKTVTEYSTTTWLVCFARTAGHWTRFRLR
jgi:dynein heavy chain